MAKNQCFRFFLNFDNERMRPLNTQVPPPSSTEANANFDDESNSTKQPNSKRKWSALDDDENAVIIATHIALLSPESQYSNQELLVSLSNSLYTSYLLCNT